MITPDRRRAFDARGAKLADASRAALERARTDAAYAWDASPISTARFAAEVWQQIRTRGLVARQRQLERMAAAAVELRQASPVHRRVRRVGDWLRHAPASIGAALANRKHGRLSVNIQNDGDMMYAPGVLWTAAHHKIPILTVVHNNRSYHEETMHLQRMGNRRNRGVDRAHIGNEIDNPAIDYAKLAQAMGWYAEGPIADPNDLGTVAGPRDRRRQARPAGTRRRGHAAAVMKTLLVIGVVCAAALSGAH